MTTSFNDAVHAMELLQSSKQDILDSWPAYVGNEDGTVAGSRPNYIQVRYPSTDSSAVEVYNGTSGVGWVAGVKIMVGIKAHRPDLVQVLDVNDQRTEVDGTTTVIYMPLKPHAPQHMLGYSDPVYLLFRQIIDLAVYGDLASGPFFVRVQAGMIPLATGGFIEKTAQSIDLTAHIPGGGARWVLVSINALGSVVLTDGVVVASVTLLTSSNVPATPSGNFRLAAIRLYTGQTSITDTILATTDIFDLRWPQEITASSLPPGTLSGVATYYFRSASVGGFNSSNGLTALNGVTHTVVACAALVADTNVALWETPLGYPAVSTVPAGVWSLSLKLFNHSATTPLSVYAVVRKTSDGISYTTLFTTATLSIPTSATPAALYTFLQNVGPFTFTPTEIIEVQLHFYGVVTTLDVTVEGSSGSTLTLPPQSGSISLTNSHLLVGNASNIAADVALSGDATISNAGVLTLANDGVVAGLYGTATKVAQVTLDAKGRVTTAAEVAIAFPAAPHTGYHLEIVMDGGTPPSPILTPDGYNWVYAYIQDGP